MSKFDKSKLPSRHTTVGPERAPHRSFYYASMLTRHCTVTLTRTRTMPSLTMNSSGRAKKMASSTG